MTKHGTPLMPSRCARKVVGVHRVDLVVARPGSGAPPAPSRPQAAAIAISRAWSPISSPSVKCAGEQRLHHRVGAAEAGRVAHQPMRIDAGRRAADAVEAEQDALGAADLGDRGVQPPRPILAAEFADHVVRPRHAGARHVGIEQERPPGQVEQQVGRRRSVRISRRTPRKHHGQTRSCTISMPGGPSGAPGCSWHDLRAQWSACHANIIDFSGLVLWCNGRGACPVHRSIIVDDLLFQCRFPSSIFLHKFSSGRCGPCRRRIARWRS